MPSIFFAQELLTPTEQIRNAAMVVEDGIIRAIGSRDDMDLPQGETIDFGAAILGPGLIDIHIHGGAGHDLMEASDAGTAAVESFLARHGVTSYCPTTVTAPLDATLRALEVLAGGIGSGGSNTGADPTRARPLGIHLEGPFLSHAKRGVHPPELLEKASIGLFDKFWAAAAGNISVLTIAPEIEGALDLIGSASARGVCVSLGHSDAKWPQAVAGIEAGAHHATHTFNAMRPLDHREPGLLGAVLTDDRITADIIADGIHVHPAVVDLFLRAKGLSRTVLITDAMSAAGMPNGKYKLGGFEVEVRDGRCEAEGKLAGSVLTLDVAVRNVGKFAKLAFQQSLQLATLNPARTLGIEDRKGCLKPGADADFVVFSAAGEVMQTIIGGAVTRAKVH